MVPWTKREVVNDAYLVFKWSYVLLCILAIAIPAWVFKSVNASFKMFYPDPNEIFFFALGASLVIYFCDVVVIRTLSVAIVRNAIPHLRPGRMAQAGRGLSLLAFRALVVCCTATILGFSVITPLVNSDLEQTLRTRESNKVYASPDYEQLLRDRAQLALDIFQLNAKHYCAGYAFTGIESGEAFVYPATNHAAILAGLPSLDQSPVGSQTAHGNFVQVSPSDQPCRQWIDPREPVCQRKLVGSSCPNASKLATEVFIEAARIFGPARAIQSYSLGAIEKSRPAALDKNLSDLGVRGRYDASREAIARKLDQARGLSLPKPPESSACGPVTAIFGCGDTKRPSDIAPQPTLDINEVAHIVVAKAMNLADHLGFVLPIALIVLFAVFELLILVYKSFGSYDALENLNRLTLEQHARFLQSGNVEPLIASEMETRSEWGLSDHIYGVASALNDLIAAYTSTALRGMLFAILPLLLLAVIVYEQFKSSPVFWFLNQLLAAVLGKH